MDSSDTCAECGHIDAASRKGKRFRCTGCGHRNDADVNAARVMRARTLRWLKLRANAETDGEAHGGLWDELKTAREEAGRKHTGRAGVITKSASHSPGRTTAVRVYRRQRHRARVHHGTVRQRTVPEVARFAGMKNGQYESYTQDAVRTPAQAPSRSIVGREPERPETT